MSGPVFVVDAGSTPLMPMSAAYARKLLREGKARRLTHPTFTVIELSRRVEQPVLRPVAAALRLHLRTAELFLVAEGQQGTQPLAHIIIDLRTDLPRRIRRRTGHRRRRRARQRYHALERHRRPFKLRRPSLARSAWGSALLRARRRSARPARRTTSTPLFQWRAQAIGRTLSALRRLVPISHVLLLNSLYSAHYERRPPSPAVRRERLVHAYGARDEQDRPRAVCAFCSGIKGEIEVEHLLPTSRGGSDAWENLALACRDCNRRKGDKTPDEAGMSILLHHGLRGEARGRRRPYIDATLRALRGELCGTGLAFGNAFPASNSPALRPDAADRSQFAGPVVAYPVPRPRKQRFSARNYSLSAPPRIDQVRVGQTLKRRVRVNQGLRLYRAEGRVVTKIIPVSVTQALARDEGALLIRPGMLCAATRVGRSVVGVVSAIHSSGRLTLRVPDAAQAEGVTWQLVVVSPRQGLRVISSDRVVFCRCHAEEAEAVAEGER